MVPGCSAKQILACSRIDVVFQTDQYKAKYSITICIKDFKIMLPQRVENQSLSDGNEDKQSEVEHN